MARYPLEPFLELIPRPALAEALRDAEDRVCGRVRCANVFAPVVAYRYACRFLLLHNRVPAFRELPGRLTRAIFASARGGRARRGATVDQATYAAVSEQVEAVVRAATEPAVSLPYEPRAAARFTTLGVACPSCNAQPGVPCDPAGNHYARRAHAEDLERARRVPILARNDRAICRRFALVDPALRQGPAPKSVYCVEWDERFDSIRDAARAVRARTAHAKCRRSDIRTAIKRGCRCAGMTWVEGGRPAAEGRAATPAAKHAQHTLFDNSGGRR